MNTTVAREWFKRFVGWGLPLLSGFVTVWVGNKAGNPEAGAAVGSAVATVGAVVANKAIPYLIPDQNKVEAANQMPRPMPGSTLRK